MTAWTRKSIDSNDEQTLALGMVVSDVFVSKIAETFDPDYFINDSLKRICQWCVSYYKEFGEAPKQHIQDIFEERRFGLDKAEANLVEEFLVILNKRYTDFEAPVNDDYFIERARKYFTKRDLKVRTERIRNYLELDKVDEAEAEMAGYKEFSVASSPAISPFSRDVIEKVVDKDDRSLFTFPGALGELIGPIERGYLFGILGVFKRGKCVREGTKVLMNDGRLVNIENVKSGELVLSVNSENKLVPSVVKNCLSNGIKETFKVKTRTGKEVSLTANHPLLTFQGWREVKDLKTGDYIAVGREYPSLFGQESLPSYKLRFLAYMIAEGHLPSMSFTNYSDEIAKDFSNCVANMGDTTSFTKDHHSQRVRKIKKGQGSTNSAKWLFESLNLKKCKSKYKELPDIVFQLDKLSLAEFLRTLFTCDGSIWMDRGRVIVEYSSGSKVLIDQLHHLLLRFGITSIIRTRKVMGIQEWELFISGKEYVLSFLSSIGFLFHKKIKSDEWLESIKRKPDFRSFINVFPYESVDLIQLNLEKERQLGIKHNYKVKSLCQFTFHQAHRKRGTVNRHLVSLSSKSSPYINTICNSDVLWDRIESIEKEGENLTYDLSIESTHNFIANDIVVHNTFLMMNAATLAASCRLNVAVFSLEMQSVKVAERVLRNIGTFTKPKDQVFPCFDCKRNQDGSCTRSERINNIPLTTNGHKPDFAIEMQYRPCTACRFTNPREYKVATWFEFIPYPDLSRQKVITKANAFSTMYGDNIRLVTYPRFTANIKDIERDLFLMEEKEMFIPDVIIVDYASILKPEDPRENRIQQIDTTWKRLAQLASERQCVVFSASQGTRSAIYKKNTDQTDVAEWIGILGHVDIMVTLNQTKQEKRDKVLRIGTLVSRNEEYIETKNAMCLTNFGAAQCFIDSQLVDADDSDE